jgi:hypothetical protein
MLPSIRILKEKIQACSLHTMTTKESYLFDSIADHLNTLYEDLAKVEDDLAKVDAASVKKAEPATRPHIEYRVDNINGPWCVVIMRHGQAKTLHSKSLKRCGRILKNYLKNGMGS